MDLSDPKQRNEQFGAWFIKSVEAAVNTAILEGHSQAKIIRQNQRRLLERALPLLTERIVTECRLQMRVEECKIHPNDLIVYVWGW